MKGLPSGPCTLPVIVAAPAAEARGTAGSRESSSFIVRCMDPSWRPAPGLRDKGFNDLRSGKPDKLCASPSSLTSRGARKAREMTGSVRRLAQETGAALLCAYVAGFLGLSF